MEQQPLSRLTVTDAANSLPAEDLYGCRKRKPWSKPTLSIEQARITGGSKGAPPAPQDVASEVDVPGS